MPAKSIGLKVADCEIHGYPPRFNGCGGARRDPGRTTQSALMCLLIYQQVFFRYPKRRNFESKFVRLLLERYGWNLNHRGPARHLTAIQPFMVDASLH